MPRPQEKHVGRRPSARTGALFAPGDGLFESVKVVGGRPFALPRHLARLADAAGVLGLGIEPEEVRRAVATALAEAPALALARLRIRVTAAPDGPVVTVTVGPLREPAASAAVVTYPWPRNDGGALAGLKATSYADNVLAMRWARERGAGEALLADTQGRLCEGTGSNVFYVLDGQLRTPTLATGCLPGITRQLLLEWTDAVEADAPVEVLGDAEEVFLASSTRDVQPVHASDGRALTAPGPLTREVMATWARREPEELQAV